MLLDITQEDRQLYVSYFNLDGKTRFKTYDLKPEDMLTGKFVMIEIQKQILKLKTGMVALLKK